MTVTKQVQFVVSEEEYQGIEKGIAKLEANMGLSLSKRKFFVWLVQSYIKGE